MTNCTNFSPGFAYPAYCRNCGNKHGITERPPAPTPTVSGRFSAANPKQSNPPRSKRPMDQGRELGRVINYLRSNGMFGHARIVAKARDDLRSIDPF